MHIFLTGGTGFIGSHFINAAHAAGHKITALRRTTESRPRIPLLQEPAWLTKSMKQVTPADLNGADAFVHLAAHGVTPQPSTWESAFEANLNESMHLTRTAIEAGVEIFIIGGTCSEYGKSAERYDEIPADAPLEPIGPYATSKAAFSLAASALCREAATKTAILRIFTVFGEGQFEKNFWPSLRKAALSGGDFPMTRGEQIRDFISVQETAARFLSELENPLMTPGNPLVLNVGTGEPQTLRDFAGLWWRKWDAKGKLLFGELPYRDGEVMRYVPKCGEYKYEH
jgi:nucleoside-diphosphate-sugar epimerase